MFLKSLDHFISIFRFSSSPWFLYDGLASRKTKIIKRPTYNGKLGFLAFIGKQMGSKVPHPPKAFGTGISSMDIDGDFRKFKEECEKDDSETRERENQRKLEKENKMRLITFDLKLDEAKFKLFLEKHIGKNLNVVKTQDPEKLQDISAMKHWIQTTSINVLNSAYAKRRRKLYKNFAVNSRNLRNTFRKDCRQDYSFQDTKQLLHTV